MPPRSSAMGPTTSCARAAASGLLGGWRTLGVATALFAGQLAACAKPAAKAPSIQVAPVERRDIVVDASATGTVEPINVVEVKSKSSGQIIRMPIETGSLVSPGELLVQLDTRDVKNQYDQAVADLRAAEEKITVSAAQKKRADDLHAQQVITATEHETAVLDYANAQATLVSKRASLDLAKQRLEDATVRAPVAGTVIEKDVSLGQVISSATASFGGGTTLLKMADLHRVRIRALVAETDIGRVQSGQSATVTVDAYPEHPFRGIVEKIEPQAVVNQSVTQFPVLVTIENREGLLKPGMNGETSILVERREAVVAVPNDALRTPRDAAMAAGLLGLNVEHVQQVVGTQLSTAAQSGIGQTSVFAGDVGNSRGRQARGISGSAPPAAARGTRDIPAVAITRAASSSTPELIPSVGGVSRPRARSGLVFVASAGGAQSPRSYEPRVVQLGVANYDYTEILSGIRPGEQVALLSAAALQAQRQQQNDRIRSFTGGGVPGMQRQPTASPGAAAPRVVAPAPTAPRS
ncbi:MAG: hypothetical protein NVS4B3_17380 [Gemmatimonadaceae bacterium]